MSEVPEQPDAPKELEDDFGFDVPAMPAEFENMPFATAFGASPAPPKEGDAYQGAGEEVAVIDAAALGRALAEAEGKQLEEMPDLAPLRQGLVGIDLGASVAVVARFNEDGKHEIVPNEDDELMTPAVVFLDEEGEQLVGKEARRLAPSAPDRAHADVKLALGKEGDDAETYASYVIGHLLADVERVTGDKPTHAAVAAPAHFNEAQRAALGRAVTRAGIEVVGVTDEALAAAVPYSLRLEDLNPRIAAVFDLGHTSLGCAFVRCASGDIEILKSESRLDLGARRWDGVISTEAATRFKVQYGFDPRDDRGAALDLSLRAEDAKKALSQRANFTVVVQAKGKVLKVGFTRQVFETASTVLLNEARSLLESVRTAANVDSWSKVDALIVSGGGSKMPMIRRMLKDLTGLEPERGINPDEGVAIGALYWGLFARHRAGGK